MKRRLFKTLILFCLTVLVFMFNINPILAQKQEPSKVIELDLAVAHPPFIPQAKILQKWANMIEEDCQGRIKINIFWGGSLMRGTEIYRGIQKGIADIAFYVIGNDWGQTPLNMFTHVITGFPDTKTGTRILHEIWEKFPELNQELKGLKVLSKRMMPAYQYHFIKNKVSSPAQMKGKKIIPLSGYMAEGLLALGAAPVDIKIDDMYMSLERGLVEGMISHFSAIDVFKCTELVPYHTIFQGGIAMPPEFYLMNGKSWNRLPPDIQKTFDKHGPWLEEETRKVEDFDDERVIKKAKDLRHTFVYPSAEELRQWEEARKPAQVKWIADNEARGLPARAIFDETKRLIQKYSN